MERITIVSADGHGGASPEMYRPYFDPQYRHYIDELVEENALWVRRTATFTGASDEDVYALIDPDRAMRDGGLSGAWDPQVRLREMDREGVAADVLLPQVNQASLPFFSGANIPRPADVRLAGSLAYNRWLADYLLATEGRVLAAAVPGPCLDMAGTVGIVEWAADHGFRSLAVPRLIDDPALPPLQDRYYEPFWSAVEAAGLVLQLHAGHGVVQGHLFGFLDRLLREHGTQEDMLRELNSAPDNPFKVGIGIAPRRVLWQLMLGGVFDRHPGLKLVLTEVRADWIPATLAQLDARFERGGTGLRRRPSEYWQENCYAAVSFMHKAEVAMRSEIGLRQFMFGRDYPHSEGTWPNTWDWLRDSLQGVPESEARAILGGNAIDCYGLDRAELAAIAGRIGPRPSDILGRDFAVDPRLVEHFQTRGGYLKDPEEVDLAEVERAFDEDLAYR